MPEDQHQIEITATLLTISIVIFSALIGYFLHTIIIQYCKRCKKTKQFKLLTQPPYITPRRICHFGIGCYIIIQINWVLWECKYLSELVSNPGKSMKDQFEETTTLSTIHWYEASNLFDTTTFCLMNMLTIIALFVSFHFFFHLFEIILL